MRKLLTRFELAVNSNIGARVLKLHVDANRNKKEMLAGRCRSWSQGILFANEAYFWQCKLRECRNHRRA